jgi:Fur family ferric uptake transcriptional regulator
MDKENKVYEAVRQKFTEYMNVNRCRKTPERYAILDLIYSEPRHFDIKSIGKAMTEKSFRVSRATLYSTLQMLLDAQLILKHQFGNSVSVYERAYNSDAHHHLICTECHKVIEYKDNKLKLAIRNKKIKQFTPAHYCLYIYGLCNICARKLKKEQKRHEAEHLKQIEPDELQKDTK